MTLNLAKRGIACGSALRTLLQSRGIDIVATPECNIHVDCRASWVAEWRRHGWHVALSSPEDGWCKTALISRIPLKPVTLCRCDCEHRCAAALLDLQAHGCKHPVLVASVYLQNGKADQANAQAVDCIMEAANAGRRTLVLGDWNLTQEEGEIAAMIHSGTIHPCDAVAKGLVLPPTGPVYNGTRRRRIDYGVTLGDLFASSVEQCPELLTTSLSDHLAVEYGFDLAAPAALCAPPRRCTYLPERPAQDTEFSLEDEQAFHELLEAQDLDGAWAMASDVAENLLFEPASSRKVCGRSEEWQPVALRSRPSQEAELDGSRGLRALRRLLQKLQLCNLRPWDSPLHRRTASACVHVRALLPQLPYLQCGTAEAVAAVSGLVDTLTKSERKAHLERWRQRTAVDESVVRSYVKRRADELLAWEQAPPDAAKVEDGWHPAQAVCEQAQLWAAKWQRPFNPDLSMIDGVLAEAPRPAAQTLSFEITAEALRESMQVMRSKTGGADGWMPRDLLLLPMAWYRWAAALWAAILRLGRVPSEWRKARVALLWKPQKRTRPITLLNAVWRAGARCLQRQLRPWVESWKDHGDVGGVFDMSVQSALMQVQQAFRHRASHFLQMDVSAYFDTINHITLRRTLEHLRFPSDLLELLCSFYTKSQRIFSMNGVLSDQWTDVTTGIPQGCPLSPVLSAAIAHVWRCYCTGGPVQGQVSGIAYIDDRSLWLHEKCDLEALRTAASRSAHFDHAYGFSLSLDKCSLTARRPCAASHALARELQFKETDCLEILGVRACFDEDWTLLRYQARKAILRARLLGWVTQNRHIKTRLLASLVVPPFAWAAGFARPSSDDLQEIRSEIVTVFSKSFAAGFAAVCLYEALGWQLHPDFACDLGTLRVLWKASVLSPGWLDYVPLSEAKFLWQQMLPEAPALLSRLRWTMQPDGSELSRRDTAGRLRVLRPGLDGFSVVFKWLRQHYRQSLVAGTGRVKHSYHRDEAGLAMGLALPKPDFSLDYHFDGLHEALKLGLRGADLAALGAGNSCWFYNAGGNYEEHHWQCLCGLRRPSRAHLLWACDKTAHLRTGLRAPRDRCEERLLLLGVPEQPPAPAALDPGGFFEDLVEEIVVQLQLNPAVLFLATDGSEHLDVGSYAVAVHPGGYTAALGNNDEDQAAFKQELLGFCMAATALRAAVSATGWTGRAVFVLDCQSALQVVLQKGLRFNYLLKLVEQVRLPLRDLASVGVQLQYVWVPSHGKKPNWCAPSGLCSDLLRYLNDLVDKAAADCRLRRGGQGGRVEWWQRRSAASKWELGAILASAASGQLLRAKLQSAEGGSGVECSGGAEEAEGGCGCAASGGAAAAAAAAAAG